jgi:xanthine dehydrogenase YagS FAD-binding subunit
MQAFEYVRATTVDEAVAGVTADPAASYLAGGTTQIDLMKDGVLSPHRLIDITRLPLRGITQEAGMLRIGALTSMEDVIADPVVMDRLPIVHQALLLGASVQLRNMATIGGNLLQRTRCRYFRDPACRCNKREPESGCSALQGFHRMHAILGTSPHCIATHASDLAVALVTLDAVVHVRGLGGERAIPLADFYVLPGDTPQIENVLTHGELITAVEVPFLPAGARSGYLKVRDRASYEFALTSAAVALVVENGVIREARLGLGGVATVPWRLRTAENILRGAHPDVEIFRTAAEVALAEATPLRENAFKIELAKRTIVRALFTMLEAES